MGGAKHTRVTLTETKKEEQTHNVKRMIGFQALSANTAFRVKEKVEGVLPRARSLTPVTTERKRKAKKKERQRVNGKSHTQILPRKASRRRI